MRPVAEILGIVFVVIGLALAWLPLGLITAGAALILVAHAGAAEDGAAAQSPDLRRAA